jgi:membrane protease YdiL (CAAX protease family)
MIFNGLLHDFEQSGDRTNEFLKSGRIGRWRWPWVLLGAALAIITIVLLVWGLYWCLNKYHPSISLELADGDTILTNPPSIAGYVLFIALGFVLVSGASVAMALVHGHDPRRALGRDKHFLWSDFWRAAGATLVVFTAFHCLHFAYAPQNYRLIPRELDHLGWLLLGVAVILPQSFGEEFFFKGYLTRVCGAVIPVRLAIMFGISLGFALLHATNSDIVVDLYFNMIVFFLFELLSFAVYFRTENLGAVTGMHWMNNVFLLCLIATMPGGDNSLALIQAIDPVTLAGGSRLLRLDAYIELILVASLFWALLMAKASPFYLPNDNNRSSSDLMAKRGP